MIGREGVGAPLNSGGDTTGCLRREFTGYRLIVLFLGSA